MAKLPKNRVPVSIGIPFDLLREIDEEADNEGLSRSEYILQILIEKREQTNEQTR